MADADDVRLAVIVPTFGNWGDTRECLSKLAAQSGETTLVCLADDGSPEPPPAAVTGIGRLIYFRGPNGGFAVNCNRAAAEVIRLGATHVLFLNNDTVVGDRFIEGWLAAIRMHRADTHLAFRRPQDDLGTVRAPATRLHHDDVGRSRLRVLPRGSGFRMAGARRIRRGFRDVFRGLRSHAPGPPGWH
jgi:GT2 family glycosyltransferase